MVVVGGGGVLTVGSRTSRGGVGTRSLSLVSYICNLSQYITSILAVSYHLYLVLFAAVDAKARADDLE